MNAQRLFVLQRLSALLLAPLTLVHLGLILYAVRDGLSAEEILARTRDSVFWALFYGAFVVAAAVHAPLGLRHILREWTPLSRRGIAAGCALLSLALLVLGLRAVVAVV